MNSPWDPGKNANANRICDPNSHSIKVTLFYVPTINESGSIIEDICLCITVQDGNENLVLEL